LIGCATGRGITATALSRTRALAVFCCFYRKLSAIDIVSTAEILEFEPRGAQNNSG
jgi:hypothetical protein